MNIIKKTIPVSIKDFYKRISFSNRRNKRNYYCPVCDRKVKGFNRLSDYFFKEWEQNQFIHSVFCTETFNFLSYSCINCGASDRDRLYALFFKKKYQ